MRFGDLNLSKKEYSDYLLKQLNKLKSSLSLVHNHMIKFTQSEIELIYPQTLKIAAEYNRSTKQNVGLRSNEKEKEVASNPNTLFQTPK